MSAAKGFALIETLVAITIASIAAVALMRVVSYASSSSTNAIKRFDSSMLMGLAAGSINESFNGKTMSVDEILSSRYNIDHPVIRETLQSASYEMKLLPKESINPLMNNTLNTLGSTDTLNSIALQKVIFQNSHDRKSFFILTSDHL